MTKKKILIVEDESLVALDIQECLQSFDYEVVAITPCGKEALTLVGNKQPNLIIMDITLGGEMDGAETALAIRSRFGLPVIFLTAFTDQVTLDRARLAQPYGYLVKPFQDRELIANIEMALYKHQQELLFLKNPDWLANTLSALNDSVILMDQYKNIVFLNTRAAELIGWSDDAIGFPLNEVFPIYEEETDSITNNVKTDSLVNEVLSKRTMIDFKGKTQLLRKDGYKVYIDGSITPITAPNDLILGAVLVFQRSYVKVGICAPDDRDDIPKNIVEVALDGTVSSFNSGAERVFGFKSSEIVGKNIETLLPKPFYSFMDKNGLSYPIHTAINKMRIKERSLFIGLLCNIVHQTLEKKNDISEADHVE